MHLFISDEAHLYTLKTYMQHEKQLYVAVDGTETRTIVQLFFVSFKKKFDFFLQSF